MAETDADRWLRRARDAATEAVLAGADDDDIRAAVRQGLLEGHRTLALRRGGTPATPPANPEPRKPFVPEPGSAAERLMRGTGII